MSSGANPHPLEARAGDEVKTRRRGLPARGAKAAAVMQRRTTKRASRPARAGIEVRAVMQRRKARRTSLGVGIEVQAVVQRRKTKRASRGVGAEVPAMVQR